jgi:uncharacterized protein (DUF2237 family)
MSIGPSNVFDDPLKPCCYELITGFYRDGYCRTGPGDVGLHTVCVAVTSEFLAFSQAQGNDLSTPHPEYEFPCLPPGDQWCLCVTRWKPLEFVLLEDLQRHALADD